MPHPPEFKRRQNRPMANRVAVNFGFGHEPCMEMPAGAPGAPDSNRGRQVRVQGAQPLRGSHGFGDVRVGALAQRVDAGIRPAGTVENDAFSNFDTEVESTYLGNLLMQHLRDLDQVAYVRFASVYREFKDVRDFVQELQPILAENKRAPK